MSKSKTSFGTGDRIVIGLMVIVVFGYIAMQIDPIAVLIFKFIFSTADFFSNL